ncbi:uncharacterized protein [Rutidosis leptorrhynchoides]|uniref:uncharacterized protein n=1 Tax=Rutidosis leptorrhynchoides TaxID=125765 RepID=UPI003A9A08D4
MERTKVKHSTRVKHSTSKDSLHGDDELKENVTQNGECFSDENNTQKQPKTPTQPPQHKKQVRRRLHTTRPYQERLLNMAEARKEIVTALKFHRASMKQQESEAVHNLVTQTPQEKKTKSRKIHNLYPYTTTEITNTYSTLSCPPPYWPISTNVPPLPPSYHDNNQDFILPSQTLGLTLNYQNFNNLDTSVYHKPVSINSTLSTLSTPSSSSSAALSVPVGPSNSSDGGLHHAMDDDEMEEIRSLGEQHQIEWNDTVNLVTSARWCSFLKTMEIEAEEDDQIIEFPSWLINSNESSCLQQKFDEHFSDAYFQDPALPCMDIGEIEAMDGDWLA